MVMASSLLLGANQVWAESPSSTTYELEISETHIGNALKQFAMQTDSEMLISPDISKELMSPGLKGEFSDVAALEMLLKDSGLEFEKVRDKVFVVRKASDAGSQSSDSAEQDSALDESDSREVEEVVVVGSHIRGIKESASPVHVFTRNQLSASGYVTTSDFIANLPQNNGQGLASEAGNSDGVNMPNLRGLGTDNTLTLINGRRLAPASAGRGVDVSSIPLSAISRIEVLTDGASAQYGSEAAGGVINIVLLDQYSGGDTQVRYAVPTRGGNERFGFSQSLASGWESGKFLASLNYEHNSSLHGEERGISRNHSELDTLLLHPKATTKSILLRADQDLIEGVGAYTDILYNKRESEYEVTASRGTSYNNQISAVAGARVEAGSSWLLDVGVNHGEHYSETDSTNTRNGLAGQHNSTYTLQSLDLKADGDLWSLPGGMAKLAVGGQYRQEDYILSLTPDEVLERSANALFAELFIPLISEESASSWADRLDVTVSARRDDYDDFGDFVSPKLGVSWAPAKGLRFRSTWGKSTRAPKLIELRPSAFQASVINRPDPQSTQPDGRTVTLQRLGPSEDMAEETSTNWTVGVDLELEAIPGLSASLTYYSINIDDQIGYIPINLRNESAFSDFIERRPSDTGSAEYAAYQALVTELFNLPRVRNLTSATSPDDIDMVQDRRVMNIAETQNRGVDLDLGYRFNTDIGEFNASVSASYLHENSFTFFPGAPKVDRINTLNAPTDLKLKGQLSWNRNDFSVNAIVYHTDGHPISVNDPTSISSTSTVDLNMQYRFDNEKWWNGWLNDTEVDLYIKNLFDRDPPTFEYRGDISYASITGASVEGRRITLQLTKSW